MCAPKKTKKTTTTRQWMQMQVLCPVVMVLQYLKVLPSEKVDQKTPKKTKKTMKTTTTLQWMQMQVLCSMMMVLEYLKVPPFEKVVQKEEENTSPNLVEWVMYMYTKGTPVAKKDEEKRQMEILWGMVVLTVVLYVTVKEFAWYLNPWELSICAWLGWFELKQWALGKNNTFTRWVMVKLNFKILGFRKTEDGIMLRKKMEKLTEFDYFYLRVNALPDIVYLSHLTNYVFNSEGVVGWEQYNFFNTFVSWVLLIFVIDSNYALLHYAMHNIPFLYNGVHRHHHRFVVPEKNFVDVRNYHPLELVLSSAVIFPSFHFCEYLVGATHLSTIGAFLTTVIVNCISHSEFDIRIPFIGFDSGDHETHHRFPKANMGMCCFFLDKYVLGTYKPYIGREEDHDTDAVEEAT